MVTAPHTANMKNHHALPTHYLSYFSIVSSSPPIHCHCSLISNVSFSYTIGLFISIWTLSLNTSTSLTIAIRIIYYLRSFVTLQHGFLCCVLHFCISSCNLWIVCILFIRYQKIQSNNCRRRECKGGSEKSARSPDELCRFKGNHVRLNSIARHTSVLDC